MNKEIRTLNVWDIDDTLGRTSARVGVVKDGKVQTMTRIIRKSELEYTTEETKAFSFVPMLSDKA